MIRTKGEKAFAVFNYLLLGMIAFMTVYPFWQIIITSISTPAEANRMAFKLWPLELSDAGYRNVLTNEYIWRGYLNTAVRLVLGTAIEMVLMILTAYPLSKKYLPFRNKFTMIIVFTMFFSGGLVPAYLNVRSLHIDDTVLALVLPTACKTFSMLIVRNFFMSIPNEIEESAKVDGAGSMRILVSIILPLSVSILLTGKTDIHLKNTFHPDGAGTRISNRTDARVSCIAYRATERKNQMEISVFYPPEAMLQYIYSEMNPIHIIHMRDRIRIIVPNVKVADSIRILEKML